MPIGLWFTLTPLRTHTAPLRDTLPHPVKGESEKLTAAVIEFIEREAA